MKKNRMFYAFVKSRDISMLKEYKKFRNQLNHELKYAKMNYYEDVFSRISNYPRKIWEQVKNLLSHKVQSNVTTVETETGVLSGSDAATAFNKYFITSCDTTDDSDGQGLHLLSNHYNIPNTILLSPVTCTEIEKLRSRV